MRWLTDTIRWMAQVLHDVTAHARTQGSRRNALASLGWLIGLLLPAMIVSLSLDLPTPFIVTLVIAFGLVLRNRMDFGTISHSLGS